MTPEASRTETERAVPSTARLTLLLLDAAMWSCRAALRAAEAGDGPGQSEAMSRTAEVVRQLYLALDEDRSEVMTRRLTRACRRVLGRLAAPCRAADPKAAWRVLEALEPLSQALGSVAVPPPQNDSLPTRLVHSGRSHAAGTAA